MFVLFFNFLISIDLGVQVVFDDYAFFKPGLKHRKTKQKTANADHVLSFFSEAALNLAYILIPGIPLLLLFVVSTVVCWVWICRRRQVKPSLYKPLHLLLSLRFGYCPVYFTKTHGSTKSITIADWRAASLTGQGIQKH